MLFVARKNRLLSKTKNSKILIIDLAKRTISDTILKDRAYEIARKWGYNGYQIASASMVHIIIITPSSLKETFMIKQLIQI